MGPSPDSSTIDLRGMNLTAIGDDMLANRSARYLRLGILATDAGPRGPDLAGNQLTSLPAAIESMVKLECVELGGNPIVDMHATLVQLSRLPRLHTLDLQMTGMRAVPPELSLLTGLTSLSLGSNPLGTRRSATLGELRDLSAECCELRSLPRGLGTWRKLRTLYLFSNLLEELPIARGALCAPRAESHAQPTDRDPRRAGARATSPVSAGAEQPLSRGETAPTSRVRPARAPRLTQGVSVRALAAARPLAPRSRKLASPATAWSPTSVA